MCWTGSCLRRGAGSKHRLFVRCPCVPAFCPPARMFYGSFSYDPSAILTHPACGSQGSISAFRRQRCIHSRTGHRSQCFRSGVRLARVCNLPLPPAHRKGSALPWDRPEISRRSPGRTGVSMWILIFLLVRSLGSRSGPDRHKRGFRILRRISLSCFPYCPLVTPTAKRGRGYRKSTRQLLFRPAW